MIRPRPPGRCGMDTGWVEQVTALVSADGKGDAIDIPDAEASTVVASDETEVDVAVC